MRPARTLAAAILCAAATATPVLSLPTATAVTAAARPAPVVRLDVEWYGIAFSPDGDHVKDRAKVDYTLARRSDVVVKVRRADRARTLVVRDRLHGVARGDRTWTWDGRDRDGHRVRDGQYVVTVVADQVAADGKKKSASADVYLDRVFDAEWAPYLADDTVYPLTPGYPTDQVHGNLGNDNSDPMTTLGKVRRVLTDSSGAVVQRQPLVDYFHDEYGYASPLSVDGLDRFDDPLPAGDYTVGFTVRDLAGNPGGTKSVPLTVSAKPLVTATGSVVLPPAQPFTAPPPPPASRGGDDTPPVPCGSVVPSQVYADPGAMSFRSSDACGGTWYRPSIATGGGSFDLSSAVSDDVAPRGLATAWVSMRGRPTVTGETDTARLSMYGVSTGSPVVTSAAVADESVTSTAPVAYVFEPPYSIDYPRRLSWTIETRGTDSYDVAGVTVQFTYLTAQP